MAWREWHDHLMDDEKLARIERRVQEPPDDLEHYDDCDFVRFGHKCTCQQISDYFARIGRAKHENAEDCQ